MCHSFSRRCTSPISEAERHRGLNCLGLARMGRIWRSTFFSLSGYLVCGLLFIEMRNSGTIDVSRFLIRRGLKIWPAYFAFVAYLVAVPLVKGTATISSLVSDYWPNVLFLNNYIGPNTALHTWSLAVEEHFYLLLIAFPGCIYSNGENIVDRSVILAGTVNLERYQSNLRLSWRPLPFGPDDACHPSMA